MAGSQYPQTTRSLLKTGLLLFIILLLHLTTRIEEHKKADSPVGLHLQQYQLEGNSADLSWEIIDRSNNQTKLLTLEVIDIRKEKPVLNTRDEFRSRELTLKI